MCTQYRQIINRTKSLNQDHLQYKIGVPCGHCEDCRTQVQADWFLRIDHEVKQCIADGGKVVFFTLTYDNRHLPSFDYADEHGEYHIPCFNHHDVRRFMKQIWRDLSLGYSIERKYRDGELKESYIFKGMPKLERNSERPLKHIICSEYGLDTKLTQRPHYHGLLFLPRELNNHFATANRLHRWLEKCWKCGFVRKSPDYGWYVNQEFAGEYVSKYITKDVEYYGNKKVNQFLKGFDDQTNQLHKYLLKKYLPKHFQSMGFGVGLADKMTDKNFLDGIPTEFYRDVRIGKSRMYRVPRYIEKKCLYRTNENGQQVLNERGIRLKIEHLQTKIDKMANKLQQYCEPDRLEKSILHNVDYTEIFPKGVSTPLDLSAWIYKTLNGRSFTELAIYSMIWRGRFLPKDSSSAQKTYCLLKSDMSLEDFVLFSYDFYADGILNRDSAEFCPEGVFYAYDDDVKPVYHPERGNFMYATPDTVPRFVDFPLILDTLQRVQDIKRENDAKLARIRRKNRKNLKMQIYG